MRSFLFTVAIMLSGCAGGMDRDPSDGIYDPYETRNRKVHAFNKDLDRDLIRPAALSYSQTVPEGVQNSIRNFAMNFGEPRITINSLLQGDLRGTGVSVSRFLINSTLGLVGIFDVATDLGLDPHDADFGETLYVWGFAEGAYIERPFLGPTTTRDAVGTIVDLFTNPLYFNLDRPERYVGPTSRAGAALGNRGRYSETVDSVLYDSADSYAQTRMVHIQNRRFRLGIEDQSTQIDPFDLDTEGF